MPDTIKTDKTPPVIIFDLGGVFIDWNPEYLYKNLIPDDEKRAFFLSEVCPMSWNVEQDRGRSWADGVAEAKVRHPEFSTCIEAYDRRWMEMIRGRIEGTLELLQDLKATGQPVYSITNFSSDKLRLAAKTYPELTDFAGQAVSAELGMLKPDPEIYLWLCETYGLSPENCLFIDDVEKNIIGAEAVGMQGHLFRNTKVLRIDLMRLGAL